MQRWNMSAYEIQSTEFWIRKNHNESKTKKHHHKFKHIRPYIGTKTAFIEIHNSEKSSNDNTKSEIDSKNKLSKNPQHENVRSRSNEKKCKNSSCNCSAFIIRLLKSIGNCKKICRTDFFRKKQSEDKCKYIIWNSEHNPVRNTKSIWIFSDAENSTVPCWYKCGDKNWEC